ncbi:MAG: iron-sulfur cluster assembly accessory protein [Euryarchaeota archaeon]|jgi:iron-sulfur cluster assembly protein|nr:iron-sulfur cluster assembly accessory protein [Euryarchaeota archaeon]
MSITVTDAGAERVKHFLEERGSGLGIRVNIRTTGCSGYAYNLEYADQIEEDDNEFDSNGVKILVNHKSLMMMLGTEIDYEVNPNGYDAGFKFNNPYEDATCGCGESFTLKAGV